MKNNIFRDAAGNVLVVVVIVVILAAVVGGVFYTVKNNAARKESSFAKAAQIMPKIKQDILAVNSSGKVTDIKGCGNIDSNENSKALSCVVSTTVTYDVTDEAQATVLSDKIKSSFSQAILTETTPKPANLTTQKALFTATFKVDKLLCTYEHQFFTKIDTTGLGGVAPMTTPYALTIEASCAATTSKAYYPVINLD